MLIRLSQVEGGGGGTGDGYFNWLQLCLVRSGYSWSLYERQSMQVTWGNRFEPVARR